MFLIRSGAIDGYEKLVAGLGGNPVGLMKEVGFSPSQLRNPNSYVSYSRLAELLEISATGCAEPMFGLLLSRHQNSTVLGDIALTVSQQPTVQGALDSINKYIYLHARGVHLARRIRGDQAQLELAFEISSPLGLGQLAQLSVGQLENFLVELLALRRPTFPLLLQQSQMAVAGSSLDKSMLSRIRFSAVSDGVRIPSQWLMRRSHYDESALRSHFHTYMRTLQQRYPDNLRDQIRDIIGQILPSGECSIERVAATLDLHPRVLQKKLQGQQTSYGTLLRETRREIAEQHLRHASMSVTDLALNLGYADVSVFSRNFKHWTGLSPRQWQAEKR